MRMPTAHRGLTLVETLAALALLSMLVAATLALTSHIAGISTDRQSNARGHSAMVAAAELIAFDLDAWSVACENGTPTVLTREFITISPTEIEFRYPKQDQQTQRTIRYRFEEISGVLSRIDSADQNHPERIVAGDLKRFGIFSTTDQSIHPDTLQNIRIELADSTGARQVIVVRLPAEQHTNG